MLINVGSQYLLASDLLFYFKYALDNPQIVSFEFGKVAELRRTFPAAVGSG